MADVIDELIAADDSELLLMTTLRHQDLRDALVDEAALPTADPDLLAGPFAHVVVDEAQELTDAEWQMLLLRCPSRSFTIVGDRAQARHGFTESWQERLERIGLDRIDAGLADASTTGRRRRSWPRPSRSSGPCSRTPTCRRRSAAAASPSCTDPRRSWARSSTPGSPSTPRARASPASSAIRRSAATSRVRSLTPELAKGLEFDLVVLVDPETFGTGIEGAVDRYVAMTRATQQLVVLTSS